MDIVTLKVLNFICFFVGKRIPVLILFTWFLHLWSLWKDYITWFNYFIIFCNLKLFLIRYNEISELTFILKTLIIWKVITLLCQFSMHWIPYFIFLILTLKPLRLRYSHTYSNRIFFFFSLHLFFRRIFDFFPILDFICISTLRNLQRWVVAHRFLGRIIIWIKLNIFPTISQTSTWSWFSSLRISTFYLSCRSLSTIKFCFVFIKTYRSLEIINISIGLPRRIKFSIKLS